MQLDDRDLSYLLDMLICCTDILEFISDTSFDQFAEDKMRRLATERQLETLGEAARRVSTKAQQALPRVAWAKIVGLRNKLAHDYGEVLAMRVWQIAIAHVPPLSKVLTELPQVQEALSAEDRPE